MSERKDGGQAFPRAYANYDYGPEGMTLRDYFAAAALTGIVTAREKHGWPTPSEGVAAADAYGFADAMLEARDK